jgi:hypothetical protein
LIFISHGQGYIWYNEKLDSTSAATKSLEEINLRF